MYVYVQRVRLHYCVDVTLYKNKLLLLLLLRRQNRQVQRRVTFINFARQGESVKPTPVHSGLLATANDWQMQADIMEQLTFPAKIVMTSQQLD